MTPFALSQHAESRTHAVRGATIQVAIRNAEETQGGDGERARARLGSIALPTAHLAQHDALTGLPNRVLLNDRLAQAIERARRHRNRVSLMFLSVDGFKRINDALGDAVGDRLLASVAMRLGSCVRLTDTVCRQHGNEFVILLAEIAQQRDATLIADKLLAEFAVPHRIGEHELQVGLSIGISVCPDDAHSIGAMVANADTAMYQAKMRGGNNYQFFRVDMNTPALQSGYLDVKTTRAVGA